MNLAALNAGRARDLVARLAGRHVLVAGDVMLDRFIVGQVTRISPEAPVPVVRFESEYTRLGGAANVAHNLAVLGARVSLIGVVGADDGAERLRNALWVAGISSEGLVEDPSRPTVEKVRIVTRRNQQVARIDYEVDADVDADTERRLAAAIARAGTEAGALIASDYLKGTVTRPLVEALLAFKSPRTPLLIDPKIPHLDRYAGGTLVTPNHHEAEQATFRRVRSDDEARETARDFGARARCDGVVITRGEHGLWLWSEDAEGAVPAVAREVADVTGAGDTVVAVLALALAAGATFAEAAVLANHAAGIVVGRFGPATLSREELLTALQG